MSPVGQWMRDQRMLPIGADRIDTTQATEFRGNSEYAVTQSGKRVKLRDVRGLTKRGQQVYQSAELTVEVPAIQEGVNAKGDTYSLDTVKVYTEVEFPEMGELFRRQPTQEAGMRAVVDLFKQVHLIQHVFLRSQFGPVSLLENNQGTIRPIPRREHRTALAAVELFEYNKGF